MHPDPYMSLLKRSYVHACHEVLLEVNYSVLIAGKPPEILGHYLRVQSFHLLNTISVLVTYELKYFNL